PFLLPRGTPFFFRFYIAWLSRLSTTVLIPPANTVASAIVCPRRCDWQLRRHHLRVKHPFHPSLHNVKTHCNVGEVMDL
ncbi:hypothetical protein VIGAN_04213500, partial [Vigna angularis var. angularis]